MGTILLALAASVGYGVSDFYAGVLARRMPTVLVALWSQVVGVVALGAAAALSGQAFAPAGFAWGIGGGVVGAVALLLFYRALEIGPASVAAPVSAAGTLIPVAASVVAGDAPSALGLAGVPVTVLGLALVARGNAQDDRPETQPCVGPGPQRGGGGRPRDPVRRGGLQRPAVGDDVQGRRFVRQRVRHQGGVGVEQDGDVPRQLGAGGVVVEQDVRDRHVSTRTSYGPNRWVTPSIRASAASSRRLPASTGPPAGASTAHRRGSASTSSSSAPA